MEKVFKTNICGVEIMFTTDETDENTEKAVDFAKDRIREQLDASVNVNVAKASIFACLDMANELIKAREKEEMLNAEIMKLTGKNQEANAGREDALNKVEELRKEVLDLKISLSNGDKED